MGPFHSCSYHSYTSSSSSHVRCRLAQLHCPPCRSPYRISAPPRPHHSVLVQDPSAAAVHTPAFHSQSPSLRSTSLPSLWTFLFSGRYRFFQVSEPCSGFTSFPELGMKKVVTHPRWQLHQHLQELCVLVLLPKLSIKIPTQDQPHLPVSAS